MDNNFSYCPPTNYTSPSPGTSPTADVELQREMAKSLRQIAKYLRLLCLLQLDNQHMRQLQGHFGTLLSMDDFAQRHQGRYKGKNPSLDLFYLLAEEEL